MTLSIRLLFISALLFAITAAYAQDVRYNYDRTANFSSYKTYLWVDLPGPGGAVPDRLIDADIKRAVDEQLTQKGLTRVEKGGDLTVGYHAILSEEKGVNVNALGTGNGPWGWSGGWGGFSSATVTGQTSTITSGTLLIDLYDSSKKQLVWRGDATRTLNLKKDPDKNYKNLQKSMAKLFRNYPPGNRN